jgi:hypothetical protein
MSLIGVFYLLVFLAMIAGFWGVVWLTGQTWGKRFSFLGCLLIPAYLLFLIFVALPFFNFFIP